MKNPYCVVFATAEDGTVTAEMPCFTHEQMMARAARYPEVRVKMEGRPTFRLRLKQEERDKYPLPKIQDIPLEWLRDYGTEMVSSMGDDNLKYLGPRSEKFYDIWHNIKKDPHW